MKSIQFPYKEHNSISLFPINLTVLDFHNELGIQKIEIPENFCSDNKDRNLNRPKTLECQRGWTGLYSPLPLVSSAKVRYFSLNCQEHKWDRYTCPSLRPVLSSDLHNVYGTCNKTNPCLFVSRPLACYVFL